MPPAFELTRRNCLSYQNFFRESFEARAAIIRDLRAAGLIVREEPYAHAIGHCDRCGTIVEPLLSEQWFVAMDRLTGPAREAATNGRVRFWPERWKTAYVQWLDGTR